MGRQRPSSTAGYGHSVRQHPTHPFLQEDRLYSRWSGGELGRQLLGQLSAVEYLVAGASGATAGSRRASHHSGMPELYRRQDDILG